MNDNPIRITLEPNLGEWERAARSVLSPEELRAVIAQAINRTLNQGKTVALRQATKQYTIKRGDIDKTVRIYSASKNQDNPSGAMVFRGSRIPLRKFIVKPIGGISQKGIPRAARPHLFIQMRKDGGGTTSNPIFWMKQIVARRTTANRLPIAEETGPSIASMVGNDEAVQVIQDTLDDVLDRRIDHEIRRMMQR